MKGFRLILAALCLSQSVIAAADGHYSLRASSHSPINPGEKLTISFDMLNPSIGRGFYDVHCNINATDSIYTKMELQTLRPSPDWSDILVNGFPYVAGYLPDRITLKAGLNEIIIAGVNSENGSFIIYNNDFRRPFASFSLEGECVSNEERI